MGKSTTLAVLSIEMAIKNPKFHIHFASPFQNQVKEYLIPIFNQILEDCPEDLRPIWKNNKYVFKNGSFIKLCGCNNRQYDNMRGNKSDLFIIDEARDVDDLETVVRDLALPQLLSSKNPNKKVILGSTPPSTPDHPFKKYAERAQASGAYDYHTIHEGWYTPEQLEPFIKESGGVESTTWKREYLALFVTDERLQIFPEFKKEFVQEVPKDDYFKFYYLIEGMDIGYRDMTAWLGGYYNWKLGKTIIEYEYSIRENDFTTEVLAKDILAIENSEYTKLNQTRIKRISDNNNLNLLADLRRLHGLAFTPVVKNKERQGKEWMVNQTREAFKSGNIIIHPRCTKLIASLEFGIWKDGHSEFARSEDLGHYDFLDALIYMMAQLVPSLKNINPIPALYQLDLHTTMFPNNQIPRPASNNQDDVIRQMFKGLF